MSTLNVNKVDPNTGTTLELGSSGDTVNLGSGVTAGIGFGLVWQSVVTGSTLTAVAGRGYPINTTSNACTVTLPAAATAGDTIQFIDYNRTWGTNNLTLNPNSLNFQGNSSPNPVYSTDGQSVKIVYIGSTKGWIPTVDDDVTLETPQLNGTTSFLVVAGGGGGGSGACAGGHGGNGGAGTARRLSITAS